MLFQRKETNGRENLFVAKFSIDFISCYQSNLIPIDLLSLVNMIIVKEEKWRGKYLQDEIFEIELPHKYVDRSRFRFALGKHVHEMCTQSNPTFI